MVRQSPETVNSLKCEKYTFQNPIRVCTPSTTPKMREGGGGCRMLVVHQTMRKKLSHIWWPFGVVWCPFSTGIYRYKWNKNGSEGWKHVEKSFPNHVRPFGAHLVFVCRVFNMVGILRNQADWRVPEPQDGSYHYNF